MTNEFGMKNNEAFQSLACLIREARDNAIASTAETGVNSNILQYRKELASRLNDAYVSLMDNGVPFVLPEERYSNVVGVAKQCAGGLELHLNGFGHATMEPGHGCPIFIESHAGKVKLYVWADINSEDTTHVIDLEGARESARKE